MTTPDKTNNPIGSTAPIDMNFNAYTFDKLINGEGTTTGRLNKQLKSWPEALKSVGFFPGTGDFAVGGTVATRSEYLTQPGVGAFIWQGALPKTVPAASTPETTGGISAGAWVFIGDASLEFPRDASFHFEGDSITEGNTIGGYKYSDVFAGLSFATGRGSVRNTAVGGSQIAPGDNAGNNISDRYATQVFPHRPSTNGGDGGQVAYLFLLIGTNDLDTRFGNKDAATIISQLTTYVQTAMNDGFTVVLQTILPRISNQTGWNVQTEEYRLEINANIRRGTIPADFVADTESFVNDVTSSTMFHDGIHPTVLGSDMIAVYLNNGMNAGGFLETGNVFQGRAIQGLFESKDKTMVKVGSEFCATSLGTDLNENKNGFLVIENLNASTNDAKLWFFEAGVDGNKVKVLPVGSGGSGSGKPALTFNRIGTRSWTEFGNSFMKTFLGQPNSDTDFGRMLMLNMNPNATGNPSESMWAWEMETSDVRPESYKLTMCDDDGSNPVTAVEFKRTGKSLDSMSISGTVSTEGTPAITSTDWALGSIKASGGGNVVNASKYIQVEINGELVNIAVINDPTPTP